MNREKISFGVNLAHDGMDYATSLMDTALNKREKRIAQAMYQCFWLLWCIIVDEYKRNE